MPVLLLPLFIWRWGLADAVLFTAYSLAIGSFYLSIEIFFIDGLPFSNPPEAMKGTMAAPWSFWESSELSFWLAYSGCLFFKADRDGRRHSCLRRSFLRAGQTHSLKLNVYSSCT